MVVNVFHALAEVLLDPEKNQCLGGLNLVLLLLCGLLLGSNGGGIPLDYERRSMLIARSHDMVLGGLLSLHNLSATLKDVVDDSGRILRAGHHC